MPTDKQRRRQERFRRHGVERPRSPQLDEKEARRAAEEEQRAQGKGGKKTKSTRAASAPRGRRPVPHPTLRRALVRAPIFGLIWFVLMRLFLSGGGTTPQQDAIQGLILTGVMLPLLFLTDLITYTLARRRDLPVQPRPRDGWLGFRP